MIVYTVGTFDLLHVGHLALLEYCATLGDTVAVGVASDRVVNSYKPNVPVIPLDQRAEMLKALRCVDIVRPYHELEYVSGCKALNVDIFVIGEDWDNKPHNIAVESYLKSEGKKIIQVLYNPRTSSTRIKQNTIDQSPIKNYIEQANGIVIRRNIEPGHELTDYPSRTSSHGRMQRPGTTKAAGPY